MNAPHEHVVDPVAFQDLARLDDPEDVDDLNEKIVSTVFGWRWIDAWRDYKKPDGSIAEEVPDLARQFLKKDTMPPTAIVHIQPNGDVHYLKTSGVELIVVDERAPEDRGISDHRRGHRVPGRRRAADSGDRRVEGRAKAYRDGGEDTGDGDG